MDRVPYVDQSGLYSMEDAIKTLQQRGVRVVFTDIHGQPLQMMERLNVIPGLIDRDDCFQDFRSCSNWLKDHLGEDQAAAGWTG
jgi:SulP family sulfate permease